MLMQLCVNVHFNDFVDETRLSAFGPKVAS